MIFLINIDKLIGTASVRAIRTQPAERRDAPALRTFGASSRWIFAEWIEIARSSVDASDVESVIYDWICLVCAACHVFQHVQAHCSWTVPSTLSHQSIEADAAYSFRIRLGLSLIHMDMSCYIHL